jgi:hypothetical protein
LSGRLFTWAPWEAHMPALEDADDLFDLKDYESVIAEVTKALAKASLAVKQLDAIRATLEAGLPLLDEIEASEEARSACEINLISARVLSPLARANLWEAADIIGDTLGEDDDDEEDD